MPLSTLRNNLARAVDLTPAAALPAVVAGFARPLRIALVTEYYYPHLGGICEHVHFFAREARRLGHHVDIVTSNIPGAVSTPNVIRIGKSQPVYANGSQARLTVGVGLGRQLKQTFARGDYDIVHVHSPLSPSLPFLAIDAADCPVVGTFHTYFDRSLLYGLGRRWLQERLDRLAAAVAVSHSTTVALNRYFEANWTIVPNGIDLETFNPHAPAPRGMRSDVPVILFLGRFDPRNGLTTLFDAFKKVKGRDREAQLVVVGDGPLRNHYYKAAGGDPDILFAGAVLDSRPGYYAHAAMYACPTTKASFGITLLESMACETAVVCSDIIGFRDVVKHEREALMFSCGDAGALADDLVRLLDDETLRARLGKAGRQHAQAYEWSSVTAAILDVYTAVLGARVILPAAIGLSLAGGLLHGAFHRNSRIFGSVLGRLPPGRREVSLTFDDGPNPEATPRILDTLAELGVRATFFILGAHAERWPELVRRVAIEGHQLGNHGYFHRKLHLKSPSYVRRDIVLGKRAIERAASISPRFFRAPHGFRSPWVTAIARSLGERTVGWSLGVWDTDHPGVDAIVKRTVNGAHPGAIILLHDGDGYNANGDRLQTAQALPRIIESLRDHAYGFSPLPAV